MVESRVGCHDVTVGIPKDQASAPDLLPEMRDGAC